MIRAIVDHVRILGPFPVVALAALAMCLLAGARS